MSKSCWRKGFAFACARALIRRRRASHFNKADVDANYVKLMKVLMKSGSYHSLATHDEKIIREGQGLCQAGKTLPPSRLSFRCCTASGATCSRSLAREGWRMRVYIPFGTN